MKPVFTLLLLLAVATEAPAQRLYEDSRTGQQGIMIEGWTGTDYVTFEEYFGNDAAAMKIASDQAVINGKTDRFQWDKKDDDVAQWLKDRQVVNACAIASENLIDDLKAPGGLPEGYEIKQVGTLGALTSSENAAYDVYLDWFNNSNKNNLDPPSYAHTYSVIKTPDGDFYTIDNWKGGVTFKKVYALDEDEIFYSTDPDETAVENADIRLQKNSRGYIEPDPNVEKFHQKQRDNSNSPIPPTSEKAKVEVLTSADPNDKYGVQGYGEGHFITPEFALPYVIRFENKAEASAPAQEVLVRDTLDRRMLDLETFELGTIRFGDTEIEVPPGLRNFSTRLPIFDGRLVLLVDASMVLETGIAVWKFTTLDPQTNDLPLDPLDGFLPPNKTSPEGEGSVSFTVYPRPELTGGTIRNEARIVFDLNEPIDTPPWTNGIDLGAPSSAVEELADEQYDWTFTVGWGGEDAGSGVESYDVYLQVNGGPFTRWQHNTPATAADFTGDADSTYGFFSVATDRVGNTEPMKAEADVSMQLVVPVEAVADAALPTAFELGANYPNPFSTSTMIRFAVASPERVVLKVYDVLGREVATLLDEERSPGWYNASFDGGQLSGGVYFYRFTAGSYTETRRMVVAR